ncbi:MAG: RagB/SusD family nutrient uptake outer membrane protein [Dysgonomonas sp.]
MNIKKILYLFIGASFLSMNSCTDLEKESLGTLTVESYFRSEDDAFQSVTAAYTDLKDYRYTWTLWALGDVLSDDATYSGSDADVTSYARMESYDYPADNGRILGRYQMCYRGISKANQAIEGISKMDDALFSTYDKEALIGEALFLRGYFYHELVKVFGGVPLITHTATTADKGLVRASKEEVYTQIEADLTNAAKVLPTRAEVNYAEYAGRITQGAAYAMLSRVYLFEQKYDEAKKAAWEVIDSPDYKLVDDYGYQFTLAGEHCSESILEINHYNSPTQSAATNNNGNFHVLMMLPFGTTYGYGINQPLPALAAAFDEIGDTERKDATLLTPADLQAWESPADYAKLERNRTGYYNQKYYLPPSERSVEIRNNPLNIKLIRLAEVYLNYAEACVKGTTKDEASAKVYLHKLRFRVGLSDITSTGDQLYTDIIKERRLELAMEGFRFWDVIRVGLAPTLFTGFTANRDEILPIPQDEIDKNNGSITQNPR